MRTCRLLIIAIVAGSLAGQQDVPPFPKPAWFRQHFSTPPARVELMPVRRLTDHVVEGKLELSMRAYIELVMQNNTDIGIERLNLEVPANAITRAFSAFDPTLEGSFYSQRTTVPTTSVLDGAQTLKSLWQPGGVTYRQFLPTGTSVSTGFNAQKSSSNSLFTTYNPALSANLSFGFEQPLLRDRGAYINKLPVLIARARLRMSEHDLRSRVIALLADAESVYWDVIEARENLVLQVKFLESRQAALERAKKRVELGAALPMDLYQPQSDYASAEVAVTQLERLLSRRSNALRQRIGADLDPEIRALPLVLTEPVSSVDLNEAITKEKAVEQALRLRPELQSVAQALEVDNLYARLATNSLRPRLSLWGSYTSQGRGGTFFERSNPFDPESTDFVRIPGGIDDALNQLFRFNFPVYTFGVRLSLPVRDRRGAADLADAIAQQKQDALRLRRLEQTVRLSVLDAVDEFEANKGSIQNARMARDFAQKRFEAEQKKHELGLTPLFFVLDAQTQLNRAENELLGQQIGYRRSLLNVFRMTGELLEVRGVVISESESKRGGS